MVARLRNVADEVESKVYLDDMETMVDTEHRSQLETVLAEQDTFDKLTGQLTNWAKTVGWATALPDRKWLKEMLGPEAVVDRTRQLGIQLATRRRTSDAIAKKRLFTATEDAVRIAALPVAKEERERFLQAKAGSKIAFSAPYGRPPKEEARKYTGEVECRGLLTFVTECFSKAIW